MNNFLKTKKLSSYRANELSSGFTLIELLIVISIIAIVSTVATLNLFDVRQKKTLELEAETVVAEIRGTISRARAQQDGLQWWMRFVNPDTGRGFYEICSGEYTSFGEDCTSEGGTKFSERILSEEIVFIDPATGSSKNVILMKATGLPTQRQVLLLESGNFQQRIVINTNGRIDLEDPAVTPPDLQSPTVVTGIATSVMETSVVLNGLVNPNGLETTAWFRYGTQNPIVCSNTFEGGTSTEPKFIGDGSETQQVSQQIENLTPGQTYYFCAIAQNSEGVSFGAVVPFVTNIQDLPPTVVTELATSVMETSATLNGLANPRGSDTIGWFRYCKIGDAGCLLLPPLICNNSFGKRAPLSGGISVGSGSSFQSFSQGITDLRAETRYYFCALASNSVGDAVPQGEVLTFRTPASGTPVVTSPTHSSVTPFGATLGATIESDGGADITERGTCWGTEPNPETNCAPEGETDLGAFSHQRSGMNPGTEIHYRGYAENSAGRAYSDNNTFTTTAVVPTVTSPAHSNVTDSSATLGATLEEDGGADITSRGTCWGTSPEPTTNCAPDGEKTDLGEFSHERTGMDPGTEIHYRGYATNSVGVGYSKDDIFTTLITTPTVTSPTHSDVTDSSATLGATITDDGGSDITERGTCWWTSANPDPNCLAEGGTSVTSFSHNRLGMDPGTEIHYRGYAENSAGRTYSDNNTFTTTAVVPTVTSPTHSNVTQFGATLGATVESDGGGDIIERGTCWGTSPEPTTNCAPEGETDLGAFSHQRSGMDTGIEIHYRGYAENSAGREYSEDGTFTPVIAPFEFTNCGATGRMGPSQLDCDSVYSGTSLEGQVAVIGDGIQEWTVPATSTYTIEAYGAEGADGDRLGVGGRGARIYGDISLQQGDILRIVVGQMGNNDINRVGGGGGSFVTRVDSSSSHQMFDGTRVAPLVVAGGGGGYGVGNSTTLQDIPHAHTSENGKDGACTGCVSGSPSSGGTGGNGGDGAGTRGAGGGGFLTDGGDDGVSGSGGSSFLNGGVGGIGYGSSYGGFGGGGAVGGATTWGATAGAGGYSGGGAAYSSNDSSQAAGGGGGSFNDGTNQDNSSGVNEGHGKVIITSGGGSTPPPQEPDSTLLDNLVSYWRFDDGSGSTAEDAHGLNDGFLVGPPTWTTDSKLGSHALEFDGSNDYVNVSDSSLQITDELTVSAWTRLNNIERPNNAHNNVIRSGSSGYELQERSDGFWRWWINIGGTWGAVSWSGEKIQTNQWYHVVGTYNSSTGDQILYVDGIERASTNRGAGNSINHSGFAPKIGSHSNGTSRLLDGTIDEPAIWNRALTSDEISELYNNGLGNQYPF